MCLSTAAPHRPCTQMHGPGLYGKHIPCPPTPSFSFGIVLWELLTGRIPYSDMTPLQAAVGVVQKGLRPPIPPNCPPPLSDIMRLCWQRDPSVRPAFEQVGWLGCGAMVGLVRLRAGQQRVAAFWPGPVDLVLHLPLRSPGSTRRRTPFLSFPGWQLKGKMEELLEVYRQQDGAAGTVKKVPSAGAGGSGSSGAAPGGGGGGLLARLRSGSSSGSMRK